MSVSTARKLNNFIRLPYELLAKLPHGQAYVLGDVFSFTGDDLDCHRTYKKFSDRAGSSRATVGRALHAGKAQGLISVDENKGYVFDRNKIDDSTFMRVLDWIITEEFNVRKNERRRLLSSERSIYSFIFTRCDNAKKQKKYCEVSIAEIAEAVHLSERTVQRRLWSLIRAGLIYRPKKDKGVNVYKKSRYTLNYKLIKAHEKKAKAAAKVSSEPQRPKTLKENEQYYSDKRARAELIAERNLIKARANEKFKLADDTYKYMSFDAVRAEYEGKPEQAAKFNQRAERARAERLIALCEVGLTEKDLVPQYECKLCKDTGYLENGERCRCFPWGKPPDSSGREGEGELNK